VVVCLYPSFGVQRTPTTGVKLFLGCCCVCLGIVVVFVCP
jgi:hypothetical protein